MGNNFIHSRTIKWPSAALSVALYAKILRVLFNMSYSCEEKSKNEKHIAVSF